MAANGTAEAAPLPRAEIADSGIAQVGRSWNSLQPYLV
jgi:hypothetical protein